MKKITLILTSIFAVLSSSFIVFAQQNNDSVVDRIKNDPVTVTPLDDFPLKNNPVEQTQNGEVITPPNNTINDNQFIQIIEIPQEQIQEKKIEPKNESPTIQSKPEIEKPKLPAPPQQAKPTKQVEEKKEIIQTPKQNTPPPRVGIQNKAAKIYVLYKISGKTEIINFKPDQIKKVYNLQIQMRGCREKETSQGHLSAAFLEIRELNVKKAGDVDAAKQFKGWMYKEFPSLSTYDHPLYNVWLASCVMS